MQVGSMRGKYFRNSWNCLYVDEIGDVIASCVIMQANANDSEIKDQECVRNLLVARAR